MIKKSIKKTLKTSIALAMAAAMLINGGITADAAKNKQPVTYYTSELTGLPINAALKEQRPIAVMVDNEKTALVHYGTSEADIVYEMINSTKNQRITRLMCIYKDYNSVPRIGSIRSTRPTNVIISGEYNAILVHDGGPYYINQWLAQPWADHLSAGFARINNGKKREFTEYVTTGEVTNRLKAAKIPVNYTDAFKTTFKDRETHFLFNPVETLLSQTYPTGVMTANLVDLSAVFLHNSSKLAYNKTTNTYDYYEYGSLHVDGEDNMPLTFKNVILQEIDMVEYDTNGYMLYNALGFKEIGKCSGYYITDSQAIPIYWWRPSQTSITRYYDLAGNEIMINPGKTYIGIVPSDSWANVVIK